MNMDVRDARREQEQLDALHRLDEECVQLQRIVRFLCAGFSVCCADVVCATPQGNYLQAFDRMERALVLRRHFFGADSPEVVQACRALAEMCNLLSMSFLQQDNYAVTLELLKKAEILAQHHPKEKATTLNNLACYYRRLGKLHTAMTCLKKALAIEKKTLRDVRQAADTHLNICAVLSQLNKHETALEHAQAALTTLQDEFFRQQNSAIQDSPPTPNDSTEPHANPPSAQLERVSVMCIAYHNMGVEQEFLKDFENCVLSYKNGVGLAEQYLGVDHAITTTIRNSYLAAKRTISTKSSTGRHASKAGDGKMKHTTLSRRALTPVSSLRLPSPISKDNHRRSELPSPRSIVADALTKGNTLPPLDPPASTRQTAPLISPEDPFFSPRFRFKSSDSAPERKTAPSPGISRVELGAAGDIVGVEGTRPTTDFQMDNTATMNTDHEVQTPRYGSPANESLSAPLFSSGDEHETVAVTEEIRDTDDPLSNGGRMDGVPSDECGGSILVFGEEDTTAATGPNQASDPTVEDTTSVAIAVEQEMMDQENDSQDYDSTAHDQLSNGTFSDGNDNVAPKLTEDGDASDVQLPRGALEASEEPTRDTNHAMQAGWCGISDEIGEEYTTPATDCDQEEHALQSDSTIAVTVEQGYADHENDLSGGSEYVPPVLMDANPEVLEPFEQHVEDMNQDMPSSVSVTWTAYVGLDDTVPLTDKEQTEEETEYGSTVAGTMEEGHTFHDVTLPDYGYAANDLYSSSNSVGGVQYAAPILTEGGDAVQFPLFGELIAASEERPEETAAEYINEHEVKDEYAILEQDEGAVAAPVDVVAEDVSGVNEYVPAVATAAIPTESDGVIVSSKP